MAEVLPEPGGDGITLIGQASDSEARTTRNSESYNPYRAYVIKGDNLSQYDLERSKAYTLKNDCEWVGPVYNEKFIAVNVDPDQWGAGHCRTMTEAQFQTFQEKHPSQFSGNQ
ncbi:MAG: hypothetical protein ABR976_13020 [Terracidiphilus sp.]